jgi:integrase
VRYAPVKVRPSTLAADFIKDLLSATGGGRARTFEDARDHAMIRVLTEGVRRAELVQIRLDDLPADLIARPYIRVVPLKGARAADEGRIVPLTLATAKAIVVYLRARQSHGRAQSSSAVWLGTRNRGPMTGSGVYRMVKRRAEQAGYEPSVYPHMFRHTFAHDIEPGDSAGKGFGCDVYPARDHVLGPHRVIGDQVLRRHRRMSHLGHHLETPTPPPQPGPAGSPATACSCGAWKRCSAGSRGGEGRVRRWLGRRFGRA